MKKAASGEIVRFDDCTVWSDASLLQWQSVKLKFNIHLLICKLINNESIYTRFVHYSSFNAYMYKRINKNN